MSKYPNLSLRLACSAALGLLVVLVTPANASEFGLFGGTLVGTTKTITTVGAGYRAHDATVQMVGAGAGQGDNPEFPGARGAVGVNDDAQLNFPHTGDLYSAPLTLVPELTLIHSSGQGIYVRARVWYDLALKGNDVPHGNSGNMYTPDSRLSDEGFLGAAKFSGADIYDLFYFVDFKAGQSRWQLRLGRQALDWGVGIFYPGVNAFNPYDFAWLSMPGAPVLNGGKLPVNRILANVSLPGGWSLEGFFNLEWRPNVYPGCGTYFSNLDNGMNPGCNSPTAAGLPDQVFLGTRNYYLGELSRTGYFADTPYDPTLDSRPMTGEPSRWSGWGIAARTFVDSIMTELGFYYSEYTSPAFINAAVAGATPLEFSINTIYPEGVRSFAVSASTGFQDLVLSAQLTRTLDFPAHYNAPGYINGTISGTGPFGFMNQECVLEECQTHFPLDITQLQFGGVWQFGHRVGIPDVTLSAEVDMQWNTNLPPTDGPDAIRLGRYGNFGDADWTNTEGYVCNPGPLENGIVNICDVDGFINDFAMGYKVRLAANFQKSPTLTFTPAITFAHDITGFSADQFTTVGGRMSLSLYLRTTLYQDYFIDLGANLYRGGADWDPLRDRGQYTIAAGYTF